MNEAPFPAQGWYADGFADVAATFANHLKDGSDLGAGFAVYMQGTPVVDVWGGVANAERSTPWEQNTRAVVFSVTKGLTAMALALLHERGAFEWDAPVCDYWPEFAQAGKQHITMRVLFNHRAGLLGVNQRLTLADCVAHDQSALSAALAAQRPFWEPGTEQGYHAVTFGMYARILFERIAGVRLGEFLHRELFEPLGADVSLGTPRALYNRIAKLTTVTTHERLRHLMTAALHGGSNETRVAAAMLRRGGLARHALLNPKIKSPVEYDVASVWENQLAWAGATATAHGLARAYVPFAQGGEAFGRRYLKEAALRPLYARQGWSEQDRVLQKPVGWSQGFLKEETRLFSPNPESFGHAGVGGALGWCDPVARLSIGYVPNRLDWRVRSPRAIALCHALYASEPVRSARK